MSQWARYFYTTTARSVQSGGINGILPDRNDWSNCTKDATREAEELAKIFNMNTTNMPEPENEQSILFPKPKAAATRTWKAAGPESNQRGAADVAYMSADADSEWAHIEQAWAGSLAVDKDLIYFKAKPPSG